MGSKRGLNALLCLVILVAVGLIVGLWQKGQTREAALRQTEADLTQSESAWQATAAQKESPSRPEKRPTRQRTCSSAPVPRLRFPPSPDLRKPAT